MTKYDIESNGTGKKSNIPFNVGCAIFLIAVLIVNIVTILIPALDKSTNDNTDFGGNFQFDGNFIIETTNLIENENENVSDLKYAYNLLPDNQKKAYDKLKNGIFVCETNVDLKEFNLKTDEIFKLLDYIMIDYPEIFWYQESTVMSDPETKIALCIEIFYCLTKNEILDRQNRIDESLGDFLASIDDNMSEYDKVLKVYENIIKSVDYDSIGLEEQKAYRTENDTKALVDDLYSIYGTIVNRKAVCGGYAKTTQYLLNRLGIECVYVSGESLGVAHAWNLVKIDGDYYYIDTTWGDPSNTDPQKNMEGIFYNYFCITTKELLIDHTLYDELPLPECTATKCDYYVRNGLYFDEYTYDKFYEVFAKCIGDGNAAFSLKFADDNTYNTAFKSIITDDDNHRAIYEAFPQNSSIQVSYTEDKEKRILGLFFKNIN